MATISMLGSKNQYRIDLDPEDLEDLLQIQIEKGSTIEATIEACFHAGIVTILTHSPRPTERSRNNVKTEKSEQSSKENKKIWKKILSKVFLYLHRFTSGK